MKTFFLTLVIFFSTFATAQQKSPMIFKERWMIGTELNPFTLLISSNNSTLRSGALTITDSHSNYEISIPFHYGDEKMDYGRRYTSTRFDFQVRHYLKQSGEGFYYGGFARYTSATGVHSKVEPSVNSSWLGFGGLVGYKKITTNNIYLTAGISLGLNFKNSNERFYKPADSLVGREDTFYISEIDIFKVGYRF